MELLDDIRDGNFENVKTKAKDDQKWEEMLKFTDKDGMNALHHVCHKGDTRLAKLLISKLPENFDVNTQEKLRGYTPLVLSLYSQDDGGPEVIEALLEKGADPNIQDSEGNSAIHHASGNNHGDVLEILLKSKKSLINLENNERETPLHVAIRESQMWSFQLLLKANAKLNVRNSRGEGLIHYAASGIGNAVHYITTLQKEGLSVDEKDDNGRTPLMITAFSGKPKDHRVVQTLLKLGADLNVKDNEGVSAEDIFLSNEKKNKKTAQKLDTAAIKENDKRISAKQQKLRDETAEKTNKYMIAAYFIIPLLVIVLANYFSKQLSGPQARST